MTFCYIIAYFWSNYIKIKNGVETLFWCSNRKFRFKFNIFESNGFENIFLRLAEINLNEASLWIMNTKSI
jgi:hypothetical protein